MTDKTKAVNLTEDEISQLIQWHGYNLTNGGFDDHIERVSYLNKRLKSFKIKSDNSAAGWGTAENAKT